MNSDNEDNDVVLNHIDLTKDSSSDFSDSENIRYNDNDGNEVTVISSDTNSSLVEEPLVISSDSDGNSSVHLNIEKAKYSSPSAVQKCLKNIKLSENKSCRVMTYNKNHKMLVVGQKSDLLSNTNLHLINAHTLEPYCECILAHTKEIRDMAFHPNETKLLASVSLDKFANLIDIRSNTVVSHLNVDEALWSCCWAGDNPNILITGDQMGSIHLIDRRFMKVLITQQEKMYSCVSLVSLPPSSSRSFVNGGFLKTRADVISVFEQDVGSTPMKYKSTQLPLKGLWTSCYYDSQCNLILSSSKPYRDNKLVRHIVSKISDFNFKGPVINTMTTFFGGDKATKLSRSCIVPSNIWNEDSIVCFYDENANNVKLFSINSGFNIHNFQVEEDILDLCPLNGVVMNGRRVVAGLSKKSVSIFSV